jgi:hypothetical protein
VDFNITQFKQSIPLPAIISCIPTSLCQAPLGLGADWNLYTASPFGDARLQLSNSEESLTISFSHSGTRTGFLSGFSKPFSFENGSKYTLLLK